MENALLVTSIAAWTELAKRINDKDWRGVAVILGAGAIGAALGLLHVDGLTLQAGVIAGFGIAGIHAIARQVG
jgi:hypothetical protein